MSTERPKQFPLRGRDDVFLFPPLRLAQSLQEERGLVLLNLPPSLGTPARTLIGIRPTEILEDNLNRSTETLEETMSAHEGQPGGLIGWVEFEGDFRFAHFEGLLIFDHDREEWIEEGDFPIDLPPPDLPPPKERGLLDLPEPEESDPNYLEAVRKAREYIAAGDIYQVNLARKFSAPWDGETSGYALFQELSRLSPAPWSSFLHLGDTQIIGSSPECFLSMEGSMIETRPIKGTRPRVLDSPNLDKAQADELLASEKERAELLMITDLMRNDLGRVCSHKTVSTPELRVLESFAQVHHLVSTVRGELAPKITQIEALRACFPPGSISGAPKLRALEIIRELEPTPRGPYTGSAGWISFRGQSRLSVSIRTAVVRGGKIHFHSGAGIVADSDPDQELAETDHKASGLLQACEALLKTSQA